MAKAQADIERNRADKKLVAAHERVLDEWTDERVSRLSDIVRYEPMYQPLNPSPTEVAFYARREMLMEEIEVEPVTETFGGRGCAATVVVGWEVVE